MRETNHNKIVVEKDSPVVWVYFFIDKNRYFDTFLMLIVS